jgi:hypothetical protein
MPLTTLAEQQLKLAIEALAHIEEDTDDTDSRHAAQHALICIRRLGLNKSQNDQVGLTL